MVSLRFPFLFSQPSKNPHNFHGFPRPLSSAAMVGSFAVGIGMGISCFYKITNERDPFLQNAVDFFFSNSPKSFSSPWASLSLADISSKAVESKSGFSFPTILSGTRQLLGIGVRKKSVLGLKNIDIYEFGVYADGGDIKNLLSKKYGKCSVSELKENKEFIEDILEKDICMTIRLQVVYSRLSIRSVRSAFEESVGSKLQKFSGLDHKELLQRFTSQFKDEYKIPRGSIINLSREKGQILRTAIDGKEIGSIESKLLCRSILDLYIGDDPFDPQAKDDIELNLASIFCN